MGLTHQLAIATPSQWLRGKEASDRVRNIGTVLGRSLDSTIQAAGVFRPVLKSEQEAEVV